MANENLHKAKEAKNDEFYTQLSDVAEELRHYKEHFKGKVVFCNCDDPTSSAFWKYFHLNFEHLGLKKLIATHYDKEKPTYKMEYEGGDDNDIETGVKTPLEGNGDFRNQECIDLLKEADIVVTNPPFSMYRTYLAQLIEYKKDFIIWSNNNSITYKEVFPLIKENKIWLGYLANKTCIFGLPDNYAKWDEKITEKMNDGHKYGKVPAISVFTNLDIKKRHEKLILWKNYTPDNYATYDNYNAINVDRVAEIPCDYCESWEVTEEEFKNFPADEWEITREGEFDGEKSFFIIPAANTELRKLLHEHAAGYKEEIEKEISKRIQKNIFIDDSNTGDLQHRRPATQETCNTGDLQHRRPATQETCNTGDLQHRRPATQVLQRRIGSPDYIPQQFQSRTIPNYWQRILTCSRQRPRIRSWKENVQPNLHTEGIVTESLESQLHSLINTTPNSLKSLEQQNQKEKDSATDYGLQSQESRSLLSTNSENISGYLQERYCNGITGVPITFFTNYNPDEFFIVGMAHGDLGVELGLKPYPRELKKLNKGLRDGDLYFIDENGKPVLPYRRILVQRKL